MTSPERPRAYTVDAAAAKAGVSRRTIYRLIDDGVLEYVKERGRRIIPEASLTTYINAQQPKYEVVDKSTDETPTPPEGAPCSVSHSEPDTNSD